MSEIRRLLPDGFLDTYRAVFDDDPPKEFLDAYELLADSLYFGLGLQLEHTPGKFRGNWGADWFFAEPRLLEIKSLVDRRLASASQALRAWATKGKREAALRQASRADSRSYLDPVRRAGRTRANEEEA